MTDIVVEPTAVPPTVAAAKTVVDLTSLGAMLLSQGAEAKTYRFALNGLDCIVKERFSKKYRHQQLDTKIQAKRHLMEIRNINKCRKHQIPVPALYFVDNISNRIYMEMVDGITVKSFIQQQQQSTNSNNSNEILIKLCLEIGRLIAKMHDNGVIHGDLTTSNILLKNDDIGGNSKIGELLVFIDFGLSYVSVLVEDKAVDLYVLERAFLSTHPDSEQMFDQVIKGYADYSASKTKATLSKLDQVRLRGRKKLAFG
ncbi:putative protein serine/threonine kinase [Heterostelium album PN500]|uniref:non-specific serine/threonine protein kinase n=1 Tax=Heterostelium pallidum (strain ATCC 26659 / Pp 5 / PN500) TaxID=670386 RepID=D3AWF3_HETP5|nr:putative protein serine/threonine kinase [Heterostelium album PN500]EFA86626.1 putative protein serine/threonine kinase [Heterostelium album PN500]|eukprot:XP_020438731.1 putative protein serine/threonine kinase [Heterostelium album PN500]